MKAVAEARNMDKGGGRPPWLEQGLTWAPRKLNELKVFFGEVQGELKKVTWPSKKEVYSTTIVVIVTTVFFGFYLYGLDLILSQVFSRVLKQFGVGP